MKGKLLGFAVALIAVATIGVVQLQTKAYVDTTRDCDKYAVIYCGTMSVQEVRNKYDQASRVFQAMGIQKAEISGNIKSGVVYQDGRVVVGGKVVATGARMAARNMGGNTIAGTNAGILSVSHMGSAQTAMVKFDKNDRIQFAVMKPCGNPVTATPPPAPPKPKPSAVCKNLTITKLSRTSMRFNAAATVKNGAKVNSYTYTVLRGGKVVHNKTVKSNRYTYNATQPGSYKVRLTANTSVGKKTNADCVKSFTVKAAPVAECKELTIDKISRTQFRFNGKATVSGGATIKSYTFTVYKGTTQVATKTVTTSKFATSYVYNQSETGSYSVRLTVNTSVGAKTAPSCTKPFTVVPAENPGIDVTKHVENVKYKRVGVNVEYEYQIAVTNTGNKDLANVVVTDTPQEGITLLSGSAGSVSGNIWTHTIPSLKQGETQDFTLKAKVPVYLAGILENTVCVDAPEIPGNPDDCDTADVDVPPKEEVPEEDVVEVCVLETDEITTIKKSEFDSALHTTDLSQCQEEVPVTELPETGPADVALQLLGVASLTGASAYYVNSRRLRA